MLKRVLRDHADQHGQTPADEIKAAPEKAKGHRALADIHESIAEPATARAMIFVA
ncbi:MAG: hypothetical protein ACRDYA_11020 [Egibacteraceae bacterium]